jgi:hypothetical protein
MVRRTKRIVRIPRRGASDSHRAKGALQAVPSPSRPIHGRRREHTHMKSSSGVASLLLAATATAARGFGIATAAPAGAKHGHSTGSSYKPDLRLVLRPVHPALTGSLARGVTATPATPARRAPKAPMAFCHNAVRAGGKATQ